MWYVVQVINGREDVMRERIEHLVPASAMLELFYPQFQTEIKVHGEWVDTTKPLFPGYLICDTADPRTVQQYLLRMDDFARVLSQDGQFVPLAKEEVQLIGGFTHRGDRVVPMSEALKDGDQVVVTAGPLLGDFAFCPEPCYDRLADLADPEDWGPGNRILKNYLSFSFSRAVFLTERDVDQTAPSNLPLVFDDDRCLFNTGLYTRRYETIYGLFEPNTKPDARQRWFLKGFFKESDPMLVSFEYLPCRVRFAEDPSELVFDYRLPIRSNIDHILGDEENLTRIPASLMGEDNSLLLRRAFEGAVVEAARRAAANYTLAVPQFYGGRIQLLLPLCLTGDKPELALTIQREDGFYAARTCLTLDMAYNNARLICRPETSWIKR